MGAVRHGIVGCIGIGSIHGDAVQRARGAELVACSDIVPENARAFADEYDCGFYTDHVEMIEDANLDSVSVCTPSGTHSDIAIAAAEAGAHVLIEKPLAVYYADLDALERAADETGVTMATVFQRRTHAEHRRAKEAIANGELGQMILGDATEKWHRTQEYYDSSDWRGTREMDGGCLMNQGIHRIDLLQWLMGGVKSVYAVTDTTAHEMEMEDVAAVVLRFENGAYGAIETTTSVRGGESRLELNGLMGSYNSGEFDLEDGEITVETDDREWGDGHARIVQDFVDAIRTGTDPLVPISEGRKAVEVILAAYASADLSRVVRLDELSALSDPA